LAKAKKFRDIYLIGADLSTGFSKVFCYNNTPDVKVADAARISMSIPLFFRAVQNINNDGHVYVDGGLLDNYPIKVFDRVSFISKESNRRETEYYERDNKSLTRKLGQIDKQVYNKETLGFRLDSKEEINKFLHPEMEMPIKNDIKTLFTYTKALVTTLIDFQNNVHLHSDDWQRTVYIDSLGVGSVDFKISDSKKKELVKSGSDYTQKYLKWYNNDEKKANK
jgi:NTE family protein